MAWFEWILGVLFVLFVILSFALLCYSVVATGLEIGRKVQPFVDSLFDFVATISGYSRPRTPRVETLHDQSRSEVPKTPGRDR